MPPTVVVMFRFRLKYKENCCGKCCEDPFLLTLSCGCACFCQRCLIGSFKLKVAILLEQKETSLSCPFDDSHELTDSEVLEVARGTESEEALSEALFRLRARDIEGIGKCRCVESVQCGACSRVRREGQLLRPLRLMESALLWVRGCAVIVHYFQFSACPLCNAATEKKFLTFNTTCRRCKHPFCPSCCKSAFIHNSLQCSLRLCVWLLISSMVGLSLAVKVMHLYGAGTSFLYSVIVLLCGVIAAFAVSAAVTMVLMSHCRCSEASCYLLALAGGQVALALLTDMGKRVWDLEVAGVICALHCVICACYIQHR